jgi:hypothetical protein
MDHPAEARSILQKAAQLTPEVAAKVWERTNLSNSKIGSTQRQVILDSANVLKTNGIVDPNTDVLKRFYWATTSLSSRVDRDILVSNFGSIYPAHKCGKIQNFKYGKSGCSTRWPIRS